MPVISPLRVNSDRDYEETNASQGEQPATDNEPATEDGPASEDEQPASEDEQPASEGEQPASAANRNREVDMGSSATHCLNWDSERSGRALIVEPSGSSIAARQQRLFEFDCPRTSSYRTLP